MWSWRTSAIVAWVSTFALLATVLAIVTAWMFSDNLRQLTRPIVAEIVTLLSSDSVTGRRTYRTKDDIGRSEESQVTGVMDRAVALATGASTSNFQEVRALDPSMSLSRLSRSVGMLIFTDDTGPGETQSYSCTGFMISPRYVMTAAHCFFRDPDSSKWSKPANVVALDFVPGYEQPGKLGSALHLKIKQRREGKRSLFWRELACREDPCSLKGDEVDGYDFAILELADDAEAQLKAYNEGRPENEKVVLGTAILGDVGLGPQQQLVIFQHPGGGQMMFVERHCLTPATRAKAQPTRTFFKHFCDTLDGSSGAPVFSRDHEVVVGLHVQGSRPFTAAERSGQTRANGAVHMGQVAAVSAIVGEHVTVVADPPTAEQSIVINAVNERGEQAQRLLDEGRGTLAAYVALDSLERLVERGDASFLFDHVGRAQDGLGNALTASELMNLRGHENAVESVAFSRDGARVATASWDGTARVWDARTGSELLRLAGHKDVVRSAAFSPDRSRIVTASYDKTARVWDAGTGRELLRLEHEDWVSSAAYSPDGARIATGSGDTTLVRDARTGRELFSLDGGLAAFSADGTRIVTGSKTVVRVWDAQNGRELLRLKGRGEATFSPDGSRIVTAFSGDANAQVWDARTGSELARLEHTDGVLGAEFSPDSTRIVTGCVDAIVRVWDAQTGRELLRLVGHERVVTSAAFSPDGARIVSGSLDRTARIWDARAGRALLNLKVSRGFGNANAVFSPDGARIVTGSDDKTARVWDADTGRALLALIGHESSVHSVQFSADGARIATGSYDGTARVWDARTGQALLSLKGHEGTVTSAAFSPDRARIVTGSYDKTARVWDARTGSALLSLKGHMFEVFSAAFSPDGARIATGSHDGTARVWDARTGRELLSLKGGSAEFSRDGGRIVTGNDKSARVWDALTGRELLSLKGHEGVVSSAAFSPDGARIVTGSSDQTARVWDAKSGVQLLSLKGHEGPVVSASFSPDGNRVVTAGHRDGTVRVWRAWPAGKKLVQIAYCRLRLVKPSVEECATYALDCERRRPIAPDCDLAVVN